MGAVYWIGNDGNVYTKGKYGEVGVHNEGAAAYPGILPGSYVTLTGNSGQATQIANPGNGGGAAPGNPNGGGGGGTPDKSNDIAVQMAGLGAVDQQEQSGLSAIDQALARLIGQYDTESTANEDTYGKQSTTNRQNLQGNKESALVNAAQGRQGLFGTLASLGALSGSGIQLANRAVQNAANADLSGAADTFGQNQTTLDTSIGTFRQEDKRRREDASSAADNARTNVHNEAAKSRQNFYSNLANDYAAMGDAGNASKYTGLAASLYPTLATTSIPNSNIAYTGAAFTPSTLSNYIAGAGDTTVNTRPAAGTTGGGQALPGLFATDNSTRKKQNPALVPA